MWGGRGGRGRCMCVVLLFCRRWMPSWARHIFRGLTEVLNQLAHAMIRHQVLAYKWQWHCLCLLYTRKITNGTKRSRGCRLRACESRVGRLLYSRPPTRPPTRPPGPTPRPDPSARPPVIRTRQPHLMALRARPAPWRLAVLTASRAARVRKDQIQYMREYIFKVHTCNRACEYMFRGAARAATGPRARAPN